MLGHCCLLSLFVLKPAARPRPTTIEIEIIATKPKRSKPVKLHPTAQPARIGSNAFKASPHSLDVHLTADHYLARLKAVIDPNWLRLLMDAVGRREAKFKVCDTICNIDADAKGNILAVTVASSTCNKELDEIARSAIYYSGILPPPRNLLVNGKLYLEWTFSIRKD